MLRYKSPLGWCTIQQNVASFHEDRYIEIDLKTDHLVSSLLLQGGNGNHSAYSYGSKIKVQWRDSKTSSFVYYNGSDGTEVYDAFHSTNKDKTMVHEINDYIYIYIYKVIIFINVCMYIYKVILMRNITHFNEKAAQIVITSK